MPLDLLAQDIHSIVEGMQRRPLVDPNRQAQIAAMIAATKAQAAQNVPPDDLNAMFPLPPTPQSALTQDRENRFAGMPPPDPGHMTSTGQWFSGPAKSPEEAMREQIANELSTAIPNLQAKGWAQVDQPTPGAPSIGLSSGGFMQDTPSPGDTPFRGVLELQRLDRANQAQPSGGVLGAMRDAIMGPPQPENALTPDEQSRLSRFNVAGEKRDAQQSAAREKVTQRAQMKQTARDMRMQGPQAVMLSKMQEAMAHGGEANGPPPAMLQLVNPRMYAQMMQAWHAQQELGQGDRRLKLLEEQTRADAEARKSQFGLQRDELDIKRRTADSEAALNEFMTTPAGMAIGLGRAGTMTPESQKALRDYFRGKTGASPNSPSVDQGDETIFGTTVPPDIQVQLDMLAAQFASNPRGFLDAVPVETIQQDPAAFKAYFEGKFGLGSLDELVSEKHPTWVDEPERINELGPLYGYSEKSQPFFRSPLSKGGNPDWKPAYPPAHWQ